jgi:hypothetical protein
MNAAQFLEFLIGSKYGEKLQGATEAEVNSIRKDFLVSAQKSVRDQIEITLPLIYLVRPYDIAKFNMNGLIEQSNQFAAMSMPAQVASGASEKELKTYEKEIKEYRRKEAGLAAFIPCITISNKKYYPGDPEYHTALTNALLDVDTEKLGKEIMDALRSSTKFKKPISIQALAAAAQKTNDYLARTDRALARIGHRGADDARVLRLQSLARDRIRRASSEQKTWLEANTPAEFDDPGSFLNSYSRQTDFIFVSAKFKSSSSGARDLANESAKGFIVRAIRNSNKYGTLDVAEDYSVGAFSAAGHTGVVAQDSPGSTKEVVGGNFPLLQQTLLFATEQSDIKNIGKISSVSFIDNTEHINLSLSFKKGDPAKFAKTLLSANFSFAFTQEAAYNSNVLSHQETGEMDRQVEAAFKITRKELAKQFTDKFYSAQGIRNLLSYLRFSPTVKESIVKLLRSTLTGLAPQNLGTPTSTARSNARRGKASNISLPKLPTTGKTSLKSSAVKGKGKAVPIKMEVAVAPAIDTVNLQALINAQLQDVISANMGDGTSKNVLNYRTGRFASSARVEGMSVSRQGMITAYYSYMKNPYATFSAGGKQSMPKSRDPKLLISKSIREIAQELVTNQLRAVSL